MAFLYTTRFFSDQSFRTPGVLGQSLRLLGPVRLLQNRVLPSSCTLRDNVEGVNLLFSECYGPYSTSDRDESYFGPRVNDTKEDIGCVLPPLDCPTPRGLHCSVSPLATQLQLRLLRYRFDPWLARHLRLERLPLGLGREPDRVEYHLGLSPGPSPLHPSPFHLAALSPHAAAAVAQDNNWIGRQTRVVAVMMNLLEPNSGYTTVVKMVRWAFAVAACGGPRLSLTMRSLSAVRVPPCGRHLPEFEAVWPRGGFLRDKGSTHPRHLRSRAGPGDGLLHPAQHSLCACLCPGRSPW